jgi:TRAP-type C4-dicarboxylate transport system substrate-binding protein
MTHTASQRRRLRWFCLLAAVTLVTAALCAQAQDSKPDGAKELKLSTAVGPAYALGVAGEHWAKRIAEKSKGKLSAKLFPGAILSQRDAARELVALSDGTADLAIGSSLYWSAQIPALGVVGLPWLAAERAQLDALLAGPVADALLAAIARAGVVPLALAPLGHREFASRERSIRTPAGLAGLKVRVTGAPLLTTVYAAFGAQPLTMAFADSQAAFADGTLDLQDGTPATFAGAHVDALGLKRVVLWGAVAEIAVFAVNGGRWNALTEAERALVSESAQETASELAVLVRQENEAALTALQKSGMTVVRLTPGERSAFAAAARGTYDKLAAEAGTELARAAEAAVKAASR